MRLAATSTEFVHVPFSGPTGVDLSGTTPRLAILPSASGANPGDDDWHDGVWDDGEALLLVGPDDGLELDAGSYRVWIHVDVPGPESIVRPAGPLTIY